MNKMELVKDAEKHMKVLCEEIGERRVGGEGNRQATSYVKDKYTQAGWNTEETQLEVMDWKTEGAALTSGSNSFEVFSSHYSLGCDVEGVLVAIDTIEKLENVDMRDKILLLYGNIASEQIAPKNFPFWNPEEHQYLISLLEKGQPKAIVCATERNSATAGGVYPFPLFEDGDFDIPSVYMKDTEGEKLLPYAEKNVTLSSKAKRIDETAYNIIGRKGNNPKERIVVSAHVDSKIGTPGAIDNATGVTVLLLLAEMLKDYKGGRQIELVAFNGEDYYGAPGQREYIQQNEGRFGDILLNINIDGAGYKEGLSCFSSFELPENIQKTMDMVIERSPEIVAGLPWYQGDHSLFIQQGCPAIAVSSDWFIRNMECQEITHTPKDNLSVVNYDRVAECAIGIAELIKRL